MFEWVRTPAQIAELMYKRGQMVLQWNPDEGFEYPGVAVITQELAEQGVSPEDIQPGDLVFFAERINDGEYVEPDAFMHISHVAVVTAAGYFPGNPSGWHHTIAEVISKTMAYERGGVQGEHDSVVQYDSDTMQIRPLWEYPEGGKGVDLAWGGTMVLVCRPDLSTHGEDDSLAMEAARLGLHTVPKTCGVLNVIKRARQFTDIKWTPKKDMERFILKSRGVSNEYWPNAKFAAGVEYTGMPLKYETSGGPPAFVGFNIDFDAFVSAVENDKTLITGTNDSVAPLVYAGFTQAVLFYVYDFGTLGQRGGNPGDDNILGWALSRYDGTMYIVTDVIHKEPMTESLIELAEFPVVQDVLPKMSDLLTGPVGGIAQRKWHVLSEPLFENAVFMPCYDADLVPYSENPGSPIDTKNNRGEYSVVPVTGNRCVYYVEDGVSIVELKFAVNDTGYDKIVLYQPEDEAYEALSLSEVMDEHGIATIQIPRPQRSGCLEAYLTDAEMSYSSERCEFTVIVPPEVNFDYEGGSDRVMVTIQDKYLKPVAVLGDEDYPVKFSEVWSEIQGLSAGVAKVGVIDSQESLGTASDGILFCQVCGYSDEYASIVQIPVEFPWNVQEQ